MEFAYSKKVSKTRTSSILNETDCIVSSQENPSTARYYSSPNSTQVADMNITNSNNKQNQSMETSRHNVSRHDEVLEAKIRANEKYIKELKSIDLSKYSFPNENKPKTGYTYAYTSSYMSNSKVDDCPMPNLCRRSRISPNNKVHIFPFSSTSSSQNLDNLHKRSEDRLSFFAQLKSWFTSTNTTEVTMTTTQLDNSTPRNEGMVYTTSASSIKPNINIGQFLDEADEGTTRVNRRRFEKKRGCLSYLLWTFLFLIMFLIALFAMNQIQNEKEFKFDETLLQDFALFYRYKIKSPVIEKSNEIFKESEYFLKESESLFEESKKSIDGTLRTARRSVGGSLDSAKTILIQQFKIWKLYLAEKWTVYWPQFCTKSIEIYNFLLVKMSNFKQFIKRTASATSVTIANTIEYKLPSSSPTIDETDSEKKEIINDYILLKERILSEATDIVKNSLKKADIDSMRAELDKKFNYTLAIMTNKLTDQSLQIELSKANHDKELTQMKTILNELENRYKLSMEQLQEKIASQSHKLEEQDKELAKEKLKHQSSSSILDNPKLQDDLKSFIQNSNENISFQKIEEYINKTFYLYNADKTGMTDFASESIGGAILYTRCSESYAVNPRYYTMFDIPISKVTISSRVVIQNSVVPGNCWSFKGSKGDLFIKLADKITPTSFSLEHIPKELSLSGNIDSAPQNFTVYGYDTNDKNQLTEDRRLLLGNYRYDNSSKSTLQFFDTQKSYPTVPIYAIELKIESNAGNKDYTCIYKFRVHGKQFKDKEEIDFVESKDKN